MKQIDVIEYLPIIMTELKKGIYQTCFAFVFKQLCTAAEFIQKKKVDFSTKGRYA